jgi:polyhydroxybutyrate depolymerase
MRTLLALVLIAVLAITGVAVEHSPLPGHRPLLLHKQATEESGPVTEVHTVTVDGVRRTYRSIVPAQPTSRLPLLIVLHGRGQSEPAVLSQTGFFELVQQRQAVLVLPDGEQRSWNAGDSCCGFAGSHQAPDVPFVTAIVTDAVRRWPIDAARVYLVGYSNGGKLAYSSMCAHPTLFAAVATYGAVPLVPCNREPPQCRPCLPSAPQTRYCLSTASQVVTRRCRRCRRQWPGCGPRTVVQARC